MIKRLIDFLFSSPQNSPQTILESEIIFLRSQVSYYQSLINNLTEKPKIKVTSAEDMRPKKFDHSTGSYIPKTDEEIEQDRIGLAELGIG